MRFRFGGASFGCGGLLVIGILIFAVVALAVSSL
jgi:hypothetical protein